MPAIHSKHLLEPFNTTNLFNKDILPHLEVGNIKGAWIVVSQLPVDDLRFSFTSTIKRVEHLFEDAFKSAMKISSKSLRDERLSELVSDCSTSEELYFAIKVCKEITDNDEKIEIFFFIASRYRDNNNLTKEVKVLESIPSSWLEKLSKEFTTLFGRQCY